MIVYCPMAMQLEFACWCFLREEDICRIPWIYLLNPISSWQIVNREFQIEIFVRRYLYNVCKCFIFFRCKRRKSATCGSVSSSENLLITYFLFVYYYLIIYTRLCPGTNSCSPLHRWISKHGLHGQRYADDSQVPGSVVLIPLTSLIWGSSHWLHQGHRWLEDM